MFPGIKFYQCAATTVLCVALLLSLPGYCAQITGSETAELARSLFRKDSGLNDKLFDRIIIFCKRDIDLVRAFSKFLGESPKDIPYIFRVNDEGDEVRGDIVRWQGIPPYGPDNIVVIAGTGTGFRINGVRDEKKEFENFILHYGINLRNVDDARAFIRFYLFVVNPSQLFPEILESVEDVYDRAKAKFRAKSDDETGESLFMHWKQRHSNDINKLDFGLYITETKR